MGYHQQGYLFLTSSFSDQVDDLLLIFRVDVGSRFIGQQEHWRIGQRSCHGHTLLFANRHLAGLVAHSMRKTDPLKQIDGALTIFLSCRKSHSQDDVFQCRKSRQQVKRLKNVPNLSGADAIATRLGILGQFDLVNEHLACRRTNDARDNMEQGGLAASAGTDQSGLFSPVDGISRYIKNFHLFAIGLSVSFLDVFKSEHVRHAAQD